MWDILEFFRRGWKRPQETEETVCTSTADFLQSAGTDEWDYMLPWRTVITYTMMPLKSLRARRMAIRKRRRK